MPVRETTLSILLGLTVLLAPVTAAGVATVPASAQAATGPPSLLDAVELSPTDSNVVGSNTHEASVVEVSFDQPVRQAATGTPLNESAIVVRVDGEDVTGRYTLDDDGSRAATNPGQVVLSSDVSVTPYDEVVVAFPSLSSPDTDAATGSFSTRATVTDGFVSESIADADEDGAEAGVFAGAPLAVVADDGEGDLNNPVRIEEEGFGLVEQTTTGQNSQVYVFETENRNESAHYRFDMTGDPGDTDENVPSVRYFALDIRTTIEPTQLSPGGTVEVTVSAEAPNRRFNVVLNGPDDFEQTRQVQLGVRPREGTTVEFGPLNETGTYRANAKDRLTDKNRKSGAATVSEGQASLGADLFTEHRGDVVEVPVSLSETDTAALEIGSEERGYEAVVDVTDGDDDGAVTVEWNTYLADGPGDGTGEAFAAADDSDEVTVRRVDATLAGGDAPTPEMLAAAGYDVVVAADGDFGAPGDTGLADLQARETTGVVVYRAPERLVDDLEETSEVRSALASDNLTRGSSVAVGDLLVLRVDASGLEGALGTEDDVTGAFDALADQVSVALTETDPQNDRPVAVRLTDDSTTVVADGANDRYFVVVDTGAAETVVDTGPPGARRQAPGTDETPRPLATDTRLEANVTVLASDGGLAPEQESVTADAAVVEPEYGLADGTRLPTDPPTVATTTTLAPGSEVTARLRSVESDSGDYLQSTRPHVHANGTVQARFGSEGVGVGDEVRVTLDSPLAATTVDGVVVSRSSPRRSQRSTPTVTPSPTPTQSPTPTPGEASSPSATPSPTPTPGSAVAATTPTPGTGAPPASTASGPGFGGVPVGGLTVAGLLAVLVVGYLLTRE